MDIIKMTAREIAAGVREKRLTPTAVAEAFRNRIATYDEHLGTFLCINEAPPDDNASGPLAGVPVAVKDNITTSFLPTTAGSRILEGYVPPYNATAVERLLAAGAYVIGKTNLDEFGMGSSNEYSAFKTAKNPYDLTRVPGGSSGGSAAAVAAGFAPLALGTDTGGSVRQPASLCGVVGLKPTYGRISRFGLIAFAPSFDQIGPLARNVADIALIMNVIAGYDEKEGTSAKVGVPDYVEGLNEELPRLKIALIKEFFTEDVAPAVRAAIEGALAKLADLGHDVDQATLPAADWALPTYYVTACGEAFSNLARYQGVVFGRRTNEAKNHVSMTAATRGKNFGAEVKRRIVAGAYALSVGYRDRYYVKAQEIRRFMRAQFGQTFNEYDFLVSPVLPFTAFPLNTRNLDPQLMYLADIFTTLANLIGVPAISLPVGFDERGLPIGIQILGRHWDEKRLLALAHQLEHALGLELAPVTPAI